MQNFSGPTSTSAVEMSTESTNKPHFTYDEWSSTEMTSETSYPSMTYAKSDTGQNMSSTCGYKTAFIWPVLTYIGILMVISLVGNSLVLMIFTCRWRSSKGATKVYICSLAIIDLASTVLVMPRELLVLTSYCPSQHGLSLDLDAYCVTTIVGTFTCHVASGCVLLLIALRRLMKFRGDNRASGDPSAVPADLSLQRRHAAYHHGSRGKGHVVGRLHLGLRVLVADAGAVR
ncbi:uncharacterized protein LOC112561103 [Pomacea canaliculata]|nr:uncharacterized protein LOC112561103 [Pomacea canaliculata]XP_025089124.1 uncharacterized protein LOC112561103 [Pomacea canaliculata]